MGQVISSASMSMDGYIAKDDNTIGRLFDWLQNGSVVIPTVTDGITLHSVRPALNTGISWSPGLGALVCGRTLFDFTGGWGGTHTMDIPVVVVTHQIPTDWVEAHPEAPSHFVTDGVGAAVTKAQAIAGARNVAVTAGTIARQCLELGLLDAVASTWCSSSWARDPYFGELSLDDALLGDPTVCIQGIASPTSCSQ